MKNKNSKKENETNVRLPENSSYDSIENQTEMIEENWKFVIKTKDGEII